MLVVGQVAVSLVLVVMALTLARNGASLGAIDLGFQTQRRLFDQHPWRGGRAGPSAGGRPRGGPARAEVAVTGGNPLFANAGRSAAPARPRHPGSAIGMRYTFVSPEYLSILRIPILRGRGVPAGRGPRVRAHGDRQRGDGEHLLARRRSDRAAIRIERPEGRPVTSCPATPRSRSSASSRDVVSGIIFDGQDAGHIYLPMHAADPHAIALLLRPRSDRDLGPRRLQEIFGGRRRIQQVFEPIPLGDMRERRCIRFAPRVDRVLLGAIALVLSVSGPVRRLSYTLSSAPGRLGSAWRSARRPPRSCVC